jgi:hypothetical protein
MGLSPRDAYDLTPLEYSALMTGWQRAHSSENDELEPPTIEETERRRAELEAKGYKVLH